MKEDIVASKIEDIRNTLRSHMFPICLTKDGIICDLILQDGYYIGETLNGLRNGKGVMHYSDGRTCEGDWSQGQAYGEVVLKNKEGKIIYQGHIVNGRFDGKGILADQRAKQIYEGEFKDSLYHGYGRLFNLKKELLYEGDWKKGKRCGKGISYVQGKRSYEGEWRDGQPNGQGSSFDEEGNVLYCGTWKDGFVLDTDSRIIKASKEFLDNN